MNDNIPDTKKVEPKQWVCTCVDCDYRIIQEAEPESCPDCIERHGEGETASWFEHVYKCPYCDIWMTPSDPDEGWVNCKECEFQFETEFHDEIIANVHKHLSFYQKRTHDALTAMLKRTVEALGSVVNCLACDNWEETLDIECLTYPNCQYKAQRETLTAAKEMIDAD